MNNWREVSLGEACRLLTDGDWIETKDQGGSDFRLLQVSNIGVGRFIETGNFRYVTQETFERLRCTEVVPGMVLVSRMPTPIGRAWFVSALNERAITAVDVAIIDPDPSLLDGRYCAYALNEPGQLDHWLAASSGTTRARITRTQLSDHTMRLPPLREQRKMAAALGAIDDLIDNNRRRIGLLEQMAQAIYREWFVHFRYPGQEHDEFVDSPLGSVPAGWSVRPLSELAAKERNAITSGPFGSKLGRKDYVGDGVPVIRGANLRVGGGFDTSNLVFVSEAKADELRSCLAQVGDVVVTQRGTLGQVGLIPQGLPWPRFVLSQSQMRVRVDTTMTTAEFLYGQLRSKEATQRFIARAMTSGVPHVNLALLREFEVLVPPMQLAARFSHLVGELEVYQRSLSERTTTLGDLRDLVLPKLVTGAIDVSKLDLDTVIEESAA